MRRLRIYIITLTIGLATVAQAGGYAVIELSGGGGWSSMGYRTTNGEQGSLTLKNMNSYTFGGHVGLAYMISPYIGLGVGADFTRIGGGLELGGMMKWRDVADTEGERYNHKSLLNGWKEQQEELMVEIPISVRFGAGIGAAVEFTGEVGVAIGLPMKSSNRLSGTVTHVGEYEPWVLELGRVNNHGFYTAEFQGTPAIRTRMMYSAYVKAGIQVPLHDVVWFYSQVYAAYALTNALELGTNELGFRNDDWGQEDAHSFMADYTSVVDTKYVEKVNPVRLGLEVGLRFFLIPKKHVPCHCVNDRPIL